MRLRKDLASEFLWQVARGDEIDRNAQKLFQIDLEPAKIKQ